MYDSVGLVPLIKGCEGQTAVASIDSPIPESCSKRIPGCDHFGHNGELHANIKNIILFMHVNRKKKHFYIQKPLLTISILPYDDN